MKIRLVILLILVAPAVVCAQEFRGTISGMVTDPSGAGVPNATVISTETQTGTKTQTVSNADGDYTIPFLLPGDYEISVQANGFERFIRSGIHLAGSAHIVVDVRLSVGKVSQSVHVTAAAPLINSSNASIGNVITTQQVADLPLDGRTPLVLAELATGVMTESPPGQLRPFDNNVAYSIAGTPTQTSTMLLDGAPDEMWSGSFAYSPPMDAVQEVTVEPFDTDAAYGHTFGGVINQVLKTGTNQFHGSAYEFNQPNSLTANEFFDNRSGIPTAVDHYNQYGLSAGGPVYIPKVYDGRNKIFWFFSWENLDDATPTPIITSVPTSAERTGDFSSLLGLGSQYQIYNPNSGVLNGTTITRQPLMGNIIPTSMLNPVSLAYLKYFPMPNITGDADGEDNFASDIPSTDSFNNELGRLNFNISPKNQLSFNIEQNYRFQFKNDYFSNTSTGESLVRSNWGSSIDEVYTFSPTTVGDFRASFLDMNEVEGNPSVGFNPTQLGFASNVADSAQVLMMPKISFSGSSFETLSTTTGYSAPTYTYQLFGDVMKVSGKHTLKFGTEVDQDRFDYFNVGNPSGDFCFSTNWTNGPETSSAASPWGQNLASFLLGLPASGEDTVDAYGTFISYYYSVFAQDNWRVTPHLTLNLGLRFEHDTPYSESFGRTVNGFDSSATSPVAASAQSAFAADFPSGLAVGTGLPSLTKLNVPGGLTFASPQNGDVYSETSHIFSPRVGFAWSPPMFHSNTVLRGGFGIFVQPVSMTNLSTYGDWSSSPFADQEGFSATTSFVPTNNNYLSPATTLSNPFPSGIEKPSGSSEGLSTYLGNTLDFFPAEKDPYSIRWNFGIQHSFSNNLMLEVDYVGNRANGLPIDDTQLNDIPTPYLTTQQTRDSTLIDDLTATVANPFHNLLPGTSLNGSTIAADQLLATYPEYPVSWESFSTGVLENDAPAGSSYYNGLLVQVQKRLSNGLSIISNYAYSRAMEEDLYLNPTDTSPEKMVSPFDITNHFVLGATYQLPFGSGRLVNFHSRVANGLLGGWVVNGIYMYQTGLPVVWNYTDYLYVGGPWDWDPTQTGEEYVNGKLQALPSFNTAVFNTTSADQPEYSIRTFPQAFSYLRYDSTNDLDCSLLKDFNFSESKFLELRFEAFNALNRPQFGAVTDSLNVTPTNSSFGVITEQSNISRAIQLGARFVW